MTDPAYVVGVDVGGTFTDLFFLDEANGRCSVRKVPTTRPDQAEGLIGGLDLEIDDKSTIRTVLHGTTVATNALLERKGAETGLITTRGFRDVLEMRRRDRPQTWGLGGRYEPVVPRNRRCEVSERTLADGSIHTPVALDEVRAAAEALREAGAEAVAIFFVNAYANEANEEAALAALREAWPNENINASSRILPEIREFERASTTVLNAYLQPVVGHYLRSLAERLRDAGCQGELFIVQSNGGVMTVPVACQTPVRTALSGPAAGVIAGAYIAEAAGFDNVITCDMGGTSFDVSVIANGVATLAPQTSVGYALVIRAPMIEITTIGAGGGSIAWVDKGGMLQVGPESAGSDPGPACYGLGNHRPTVTDANVATGRINANQPIGGKLASLDVEAAKAAIETHVAQPLGLDLMTAAEAIIRVANSRMAGAIRLVSIERGHDPERFAAMSFGGGGALHAGALIKEVGLARAIVPRFPGVTSALGCVIADMRHDYVRTWNSLLESLEVAALQAGAATMIAQGRELLDEAGINFAAVDTIVALDMSYVGQTHTVDVPLADGDPATLSRGSIRTAFEYSYAEAYGALLEGVDIRILNLRVAVIGRRPKFDLTVLAPRTGAEAAAHGSRRIWIDGGWQDAAIYARLDLPVGMAIPGPAILEQPDTTILVEPGHVGTVDRFGNLILAPA